MRGDEAAPRSARALAAAAGVALIVLLLAVAQRGAAQGQLQPCAGGNSALMLVGLDRTADYRQTNDFTIEENLNTYASYNEPVRLTVRDEATGRVFSEDSNATLDTPYYIRLDPGDGPAVVSLSYAEVPETEAPNCQRIVEVIVRPTGRTRPKARPRVYFPSRCTNHARRPRSVVIACGDGNLQLRGMRWRRWDRDIATGHGTAIANDCIPYCAAGHFHNYPARVRLWRVQTCDDSRRYYTRLTLLFGASRPAGHPRRARYPFGCRLIMGG